MQYIPLNFGIMAVPSNWLVVMLMVLIPGLGLALIAHPNN